MRAMKLSIAAFAAAIAVSGAPAAANADACAVAPAKLRALAAGTDAATARKAERNIQTGEALCEARNRAEATKKFNLAARALGTELAAVLATDTTALAQ
ncbi:MAG: hypothetical protein ACK4Z0_06740 [Sphingomonadaceae bacterium]